MTKEDKLVALVSLVVKKVNMVALVPKTSDVVRTKHRHTPAKLDEVPMVCLGHRWPTG